MAKRPLRTTRKISNLQGRPGWYRITNQAAGPVKVAIYDEIGFWGVSADEFMRDLAQVAGDIELHLNSPGGDVFDGIAIYNTLRQRAGVVAVVVDGLAASAASFIAQAASPGRLAMAPHSQMMIHDGFGMSIGNAADMREMAGLLDKASDNIAGIYADRTGKPASYWRDKMTAESWFDDHEAVAEGLADHVLGQEPVQNKWDLSVYLHPRNADGNHAPMTGTHTHSHADGDGGDHSHEHSHDGDASHYDHEHDPDGDGDDDSTAEGDTDHDYVKPDGSPGPKAATDRFGHVIRAASVDESDWDGPAAMSRASKADDPAAALNAICAGKRDGDPKTQAAHALPHHKNPGDPPNRHGVSAALGRIDGTQGLTNKAAAEAHLKAHQSAMGSAADNQAEQEFLAIVAGELDQLAAGKE